MQPFYIWQTHMYGTGKIDETAEAEVWKFRPMPCTPAGDYLGMVKTGARAIEIVERLNSEWPGIQGPVVEWAKNIVAEG
jgi:hypothetical protein